MTIRKTFLLALMAISFISISINTLFLNSMVDKYFMKYLSESYDNHIDELKEYLEQQLATKNILDLNELSTELETHLDDPIVGIKLFDAYKKQILYVAKDEMPRHMMMNSRLEQTDRYILKDGEATIAEIHIILNSSIEESLVARRFKSSLLRYGAMGFLLAGFLASLVGILLSKSMSKDLLETYNMAQSIDLSQSIDHKFSKIKEIRSVQNSLISLNQNLKLKQSYRKQLTDELRHKVQTPITIIKTHLEGIEDGIIEWNETENTIFKVNIEEIANLLTDIDKLIKTDSKIDELVVSEFDLVEIIKDISNSLKLQYQKKRMTIDLNLPKRLEVKLDEYKIRQIMYNLFTNANKYAGNGSEVCIDIKVKEYDFEISFADDGEGIEEEDLKKLLEPYHRGVKHKDINGQGLGLYILSQNISAMKGDISIQKNDPSGLKFVIRLPINIEY